MSAGIVNYEARFTVNYLGHAPMEMVISDANKVTIEYGKIGVAAEQMSYRALRSTQGLIFGLQMSTFYASMFATALIRDDSALISLEGAQERYNKALREHGRNSEEARAATRALELAQNNLQRAQTMSSLMHISIGLQAVGLAVSFIQWAKSIDIATMSLTAYTKILAISHTLTPAGWAILAGAAITGVGAYGIISSLNQAPQVNIGGSQITVMGEKDLDTALDVQNQQIKQEYRRQVGK